MISSEYYRQQARVLREWASRSDAATAEKVRQRAQEYLVLAEAISTPAAPISIRASDVTDRQ